MRPVVVRPIEFANVFAEGHVVSTGNILIKNFFVAEIYLSLFHDVGIDVVDVNVLQVDTLDIGRILPFDIEQLIINLRLFVRCSYLYFAAVFLFIYCLIGGVGTSLRCHHVKKGTHLV